MLLNEEQNRNEADEEEGHQQPVVSNYTDGINAAAAAAAGSTDTVAFASTSDNGMGEEDVACSPADPSEDNDSTIATVERGSGNNHTAASSSSLSSSSSSWCWLAICQLQAVLTQIALSKYRTPVSTCMEILTPVLMILVLVASYHLSDTFDFDAGMYDSVQVQVPGPWAVLTQQVWQLYNETNSNNNTVIAEISSAITAQPQQQQDQHDQPPHRNMRHIWMD